MGTTRSRSSLERTPGGGCRITQSVPRPVVDLQSRKAHRCDVSARSRGYSRTQAQTLEDVRRATKGRQREDEEVLGPAEERETLNAATHTMSLLSTDVL